MKFKSGEWRKAGMIWIHSSGMRLHPSGMIRLPSSIIEMDGQIIRIECEHYMPTNHDYPRIQDLEILYGNRRRAFMAFAIEKLTSFRQQNTPRTSVH